MANPANPNPTVRSFLQAAVTKEAAPPLRVVQIEGLEDLSIMFKLGAGFVAGAAIIKYGSIIFPEITRPNIFLALFMILSAVILAVVLLFNQSRLE